MGLLRLFLALSVVVFHSYPIFGYKILDAAVAVHSFFVISGFYMALILNEKYIGKNSSYKLFLGNRLLRIYPLYWTILILLLSFSFIKLITVPSHENALSVIFNFAVSSHDFWGNIIISFLRNITLIFTTDYFHQNFKDPGHLVLLPAWSLQIEVLFYLLAPFLVKFKTRFLLLLVVLFGFITFTNIIPIIHSDLSITYIFISRFVFFLLGILSYQLYKMVKIKQYLINYSFRIFIAFLLFIIIFGVISTNSNFLSQFKTIYPFYYIVLLSAIPFIFNFSQNLSFDSALGNLSYPVYLSHILVFKMISNSHIAQDNQSFIGLLTIVATIIFSYVLVKIIEKPIDIFREKRLYTINKKQTDPRTSRRLHI